MSGENVVSSEEPASTPSTPGSSVDEEKYLVPYRIRPRVKKKWLRIENVPIATIAVTIIQIAFHIFSTPSVEKHLRFEPSKRTQIWRFLTYMLVHDDWYHLLLNVVIQCIFAILLEKRQGRFRVLVLYFLGGVTGVMGASCVHPNMVIGASAGVYALLISNIADIVLNSTAVRFKIYRVCSIGVLVLFDVIYNIVHIYARKEPVISWEAHVVGGISGLLIGFLIFKSDCQTEKLSERKTIFNAIFWTSLVLYCTMLIGLVLVSVQIKKCTPASDIYVKYVYFC
ncbi:unnamed protein product [Phaedon cochleariae]|uniref:Peptidase S54 rhomboid domain-containing protein n=1 Tax=Phaedon cochleariae TaxID=80249 RepID=A0A9P0DPK4_PHACE|nr:unnamed protein product [Phaedon cochleariae]